MVSRSHSLEPLFQSPEIILSMVLVVLALVIFGFRKKIFGPAPFRLEEFIFIFFIPMLWIGHFHEVLPVILVNLLILGMGILFLIRGSSQDHLGILNFGLALMAILVACRFFDSHWSFVVRGLLFVGVGTMFFVFNFYQVKKRKK